MNGASVAGSATLPPTRIRIGTSGYAFKDWVAADLVQGQGLLFGAQEPVAGGVALAGEPAFPFYPRGVRDQLRFYAERFGTVEINSTYYGMPSPAHAERWARHTPDGFAFWVKVPGTVTHEQRLGDCAEFSEAMQPLRDAGKLAGFLAQFPMAFRRSAATRRTVESLARLLPDDPLAVEFRHASWDAADTYQLLATQGLQIVSVDEPRTADLFPSKPLQIPATTLRRAPGRPPAIGYLRLHSRSAERWFRGEALRYDYLYSERELREWQPWLEQLRAGHDSGEVYVYFNNCKRGQAVENARQLERILREPGDTSC